MINRKIFNSIFRTTLIVMTFVFMISGCNKSFDIPKTEPKIDVQESVISGPQTMRQVITLTSSYPWLAEASDEWIKVSKNRGQALKLDSIVFTCGENQSMEDREGWVEVRLMDQLSHRIKVVQKGRGSLITLSQSLVYFNRQGGEVVIDVITNQEWEPEVSSKDGFTFTKVGENQLKIVASTNPTTSDKTMTIKLVDQGKTTDASLNIIQKPTDNILFLSLEDDKKDVLFMKEAASLEIPVTLNVDYETIPSASWMQIASAPKIKGDNVQGVTIGVNLSINQTGVERDGYIVIKEKGTGVEASDTLFVSQRGRNQIIYVKPGGNGDGTSWEYAFGSVHDAMGVSSNNGDMEIRIAAGEYQFKSTLIWKAVNVYGGFSGTETRFKQRDLKNKPVFRGGAFNFMSAWAFEGEFCWMDGVIFTDSDNYTNTGVGSFEIYKNHGFRNCEFRNIRHGNAIGYFQNCKIENSVFTNLKTQRYLLRADNTELYNVTVANSVAKDWNSNYIYGGSKIYNSVFWNIKILEGDRYRALTIGGNVSAVSCAIQSGITETGLIPTNCIELDADNSSPNGPNFVNPTGQTPNFALKAGSRLIDAGNSNYAKGTYDIISNPRISGSSIDMGAYEYVGNE